jgi:DNA polymerase-3 subunit epsilon
MKNLKLLKPMVLIDLETTGLNPWSDRIVEVTLLRLDPDGNEELFTKLINPCIPIPEEATAIHGISDSDVADKPTFKQCANDIREFIRDYDIGGFNVKRFDLPFLETEFRRAAIKFSRQNRSIIDAQVIYHKFERRDLEAAYRKYCGKELDNRHSSVVDVRATVEILDAQISLYNELPRDVCGLHEFCCAPGESDWVDTSGRFVTLEGEITFNFGKHKGERLKDIAKSDPDYLDLSITIIYDPPLTTDIDPPG